MVFVLVLINDTSWNWTILLLWRDVRTEPSRVSNSYKHAKKEQVNKE